MKDHAPQASPNTTSEPADGEVDKPAASEDRGSPIGDDPLAAAERIAEELAAMKRYAAYYVAVRVALVKSKIRRILVSVCVGALIVAGLLTLLVAATLQLAQGVAGGFATLFPQDRWLGLLLSGGTLLIAFGILGGGAKMWLQRSALRRAVRKTREWRRSEDSGMREREATPSAALDG